MKNITHYKNQRIALANTLSNFRRKSNFKRSYLASKIGLSVASIDKMEQGFTCLRFTDVETICTVLEVDMNEFVLAYKSELAKFSHTPLMLLIVNCLELF